MYRGDDRTFSFTVALDGAPVDLTGAAITFSARAALDDVDPTFTLTETGGDIEILPDQGTTGKGKITVTIPSADTVDLEPGLLLCDVQILLDGSTWTWPEAAFSDSTLIRLRIKGDVTQP